MRRLSPLMALMLLFTPALPLAAQADGGVDAPYANNQLPDAAKEAEARALMGEIRCVQCQSQSIADSDAPIAGAMRSEVRTRIAAGQSADSIRDYFIARYGDYITFDPPMTPLTWPLWFAPILVIAFGLWLAKGRFKR
ncbi:cytochrome c-type biogenesis protein [Novosphingopyxis sp.]|uniref:cytochrome c-type biogenesis protein n=1 Tax=Novosphingopyxis sp. TaxID=2709690 RepID=UPI003B59C027